MDRRDFLKAAGMGTMALAGCATSRPGANRSRRPNVVLIMTDDQGWGDLGCHGNPDIHTPVLDKLHGESARLTQFQVCPVCSPTRASLMTGRYNFRTGAIDTYLGRSMMYPDEVTVAEVLSGNGYRTGIFGKWHLGDNYPLRAIDQGFDEALVHNGGGLAQPSGPPENHYFDPVLDHNGVKAVYPGYCTDIFTDAAIDFIEANAERPFFLYVPTNAPHTPLEVDDAYVAPYLAAGLSEHTARAYGMITNLDENVGKLLAAIDANGLRDDTIVIFLTDNGPQMGGEGTIRYNGGLRGAKASVYQGGIQVPCFVRWPMHIGAGKEFDRIAAHIDLMPTILDACGAATPENLDGISLMPLLTGADVIWPDRTLFTQWHRGDVPERFRNCAVRTQRYKLVDGTELYDLEADPGEQRDIAGEHPDLVIQLRDAYDAWLHDVSNTRGYEPPRIHLGSPYENPTTLTRQDWRGAEGWGDGDRGYWRVHVEETAAYDITLRWSGAEGATAMGFELNGTRVEHPLPTGAKNAHLPAVTLSKGDGDLQAWLVVDGKTRGVAYVDVEKR